MSSVALDRQTDRQHHASGADPREYRTAALGALKGDFGAESMPTVSDAGTRA